MKVNYILFAASFLLLLVACKTTGAKKTVSNDPKSCHINATVKDYTGTDGCQFILELDNSGEKLIPIKVKDKSFLFENNQFVSIAYKELEDAMTACMVGKAVEITCIQLHKPRLITETDKPAKRACSKLNGAFDIGWMKDLVVKHKPRKIDRYRYLEDGYAYELQAEDATYWYDCQGNFLCSTKKGETADARVQNLEGQFTIWVVNN